MLRLPAQVGHPFRISISAAIDDATLAASITDPAGTVTVLSLTADGQGHKAQHSPAAAGVHTVEITASDDPDLVGLTFELVAGVQTPGDLVVEDQVLDPACGQMRPVRWPCPYLPGLQCIDEYALGPILSWMGIATDTLFRDTVSRFPGCHWYGRVRPRISGSCLSPAPSGRLGFDLFHTVRYPVLELLEIEIEGVAQDLGDWSLEQQRWLIPGDGISWPSQDWDQDLGGLRTWSVQFRYGRAAPALVARARDLFAYAMILDTEPTTGGSVACRLPDGTTQLSENGRTITMDVANAGGVLHQQLIKRWGGSAWAMSQLIDPAEATSRGSRTARWVPGDQAPASHRVFLQSGCDLEQEVTDLAA